MSEENTVEKKISLEQVAMVISILLFVGLYLWGISYGIKELTGGAATDEYAAPRPEAGDKA